eukprot:gene9469-10283_t
MEGASKKKVKYESQRRSSYLDLYLNHCIGLASRSPDPTTKVGCVIIDQNCQILAQGFNGEISGGQVREGKVDRDMQSLQEVVAGGTSSRPRVKLVEVEGKDVTIRLGIEQKLHKAAKTEDKTEEQEELLKERASSKGADSAIHAEMNAVLYSEVPRSRFEGSIVIVSLMPCPQCFKLLAQLKVKSILVLSDSGRYIDTIKQILELPTAPKIVTLDQLENLIQLEYCSPAKVFKSKLAHFLPHVQNVRSSSGAKKREESLPDLKDFDCDYHSINIHYPDLNPAVDLAKVFFRLQDK